MLNFPLLELILENNARLVMETHCFDEIDCGDVVYRLDDQILDKDDHNAPFEKAIIQEIYVADIYLVWQALKHSPHYTEDLLIGIKDIIGAQEDVE